MSDIMKVGCIQMDMAFGSVDENYAKAERLIRDAAKKDVDVIVLPETWNTGFSPKENTNEYCDKNGERTKRVIGGLAKELNVNIVAGSVANLKGDKIYNTAYIFDRAGNCIGEYDKTHLFSPMGEDKFFEKGKNICKFTLDGKNCGIIICYDIRFPELTRKMALGGLDCLFIVSQWPSVRINHLTTLVKARAIENQMFTVCCNSCGRSQENIYGGSSLIVDPWGNELIKAGDSEEVIDSVLDFSVIGGIRDSINVFKDRRVDLYEI